MSADKHQPLSSTTGVTFCSYVSWWSDDAIQAGLADRHVQNAYRVHEKQEGK
jgi:hypothetical protein